MPNEYLYLYWIGVAAQISLRCSFLMFLAQRVLNIESPVRSGSYATTAETVANYLV
jgi:hypothetical protein